MLTTSVYNSWEVNLCQQEIKKNKPVTKLTVWMTGKKTGCLLTRFLHMLAFFCSLEPWKSLTEVLSRLSQSVDGRNYCVIKHTHTKNKECFRS